MLWGFFLFHIESLGSCHTWPNTCMHIYICIYIKYMYFICIYLSSLFASSKTHLEEKRLWTYPSTAAKGSTRMPGIHKTSTCAQWLLPRISKVQAFLSPARRLFKFPFSCPLSPKLCRQEPPPFPPSYLFPLEMSLPHLLPLNSLVLAGTDGQNEGAEVIQHNVLHRQGNC